MTRDEVLKELDSLARQSDNAARASEAASAVFKAEYEEMCRRTDEVPHERMREIYSYVVQWPQDARRQRREADVFRAAMALIEAPVPADSCDLPGPACA